MHRRGPREKVEQPTVDDNARELVEPITYGHDVVPMFTDEKRVCNAYQVRSLVGNIVGERDAALRKVAMMEGTSALASVGVDAHAAMVDAGQAQEQELMKCEAERDKLRTDLEIVEDAVRNVIDHWNAWDHGGDVAAPEDFGLLSTSIEILAVLSDPPPEPEPHVIKLRKLSASVVAIMSEKVLVAEGERDDLRKELDVALLACGRLGAERALACTALRKITNTAGGGTVRVLREHAEATLKELE